MSNAPSVRITEYEEAFELTGHGRFNKYVLISGTLIYIHSLLEMVAIGFIMTPAECDLKMTVHQKSMINSAVFIGICLTSFLWGELTDHLGRRVVILPTVFAAVFTSFLSSLCSNFWLMFFLRLLTGCLISASSATSLVYVGELHTNVYKDRALTIIFMSAQIAFVILPIIALVILPREFEANLFGMGIRSWRPFMWVWGSVGVAGAVMLIFLPESPSFLLTTQHHKVQPILAKIYAVNKTTTPAEFHVDQIKEHHHVAAKKGFWNEIMDDLTHLLRPPMLRCYVLTHICMFLTVLSSNGLYLWLPDFVSEVLENMGSNANMCEMITWKYHPHLYRELPLSNETGCPIINTMIYPTVFLMELLYLIPFVLVLKLSGKYKKTSMYVLVTNIIIVVIAKQNTPKNSVYYNSPNSEKGSIIHLVDAIALILASVIPKLPIALFFLMINASTISCCPLVSELAMEAFPTNLRALAMCTLFMAGQIGAVVGNSAISIMGFVWCPLIFTVIALVSAGAAVALVKMWPDIHAVRQQMESQEYTY